MYALGRSDGPHIRQGFAYPAIFLTFYILYRFIYYFSKSKLKILKSNIVIFLISPIFFIYLFIVNVNINNIFSFKGRVIEYVSTEDKFFLSEEDFNFIKLTSNIVKNENCIQLFTNDAALLYLLKKPNCTRYYFVYSIGSISNQEKMINEMTNTNLIILNGKTDNWDMPLSIKYPLVFNFINKNYTEYKNIGNRLLKIKKN